MKNLAKSAKPDTVVELTNFDTAKAMKMLVISVTWHYLPDGCPFS